MSWILNQLKESVKWEVASDIQIRKLLQYGTCYPYANPGCEWTFKQVIDSWVVYLEGYKTRSNGDIELALQLAEQDAEVRYQEGLKWMAEHKEEVEALFAKYK